MKGSCFSCLLLFSLFYLATSQGIRNWCSLETAQECFKVVVKYSGKNDFVSNYGNTTAMNEMCHNVKQALTCIQELTHNCAEYKEVESLRRVMNVQERMLSMFCERRITPAQLDYYKCFKRTKQFQQRCSDDIRSYMMRNQGRDWDRDRSYNDRRRNRNRVRDSDKRKGCEMLKKYKTCNKNILNAKCGTEATNFLITNIIDPFFDMSEFGYCYSTASSFIGSVSIISSFLTLILFLAN